MHRREVQISGGGPSNATSRPTRYQNASRFGLRKSANVSIRDYGDGHAGDHPESLEVPARYPLNAGVARISVSRTYHTPCTSPNSRKVPFAACQRAITWKLTRNGSHDARARRRHPL